MGPGTSGSILGVIRRLHAVTGYNTLPGGGLRSHSAFLVIINIIHIFI